MTSIYLNTLAVAMGGALGAALRHTINILTMRIELLIPVGTLLSNYIGCILIGWLFAIRSELSPSAKHLVIPGILGGLTTMSGFAIEIVTYIDDKKWSVAIWYGCLTIIGCVLLAWISWRLGSHAQN